MTDSNSKPTYRISDLHESDRPRERLENLGPQVLTNAELIAILLRVGVPGENAVEVAQRLLNKFGGLSGLHRTPFEELVNQHGLGEAKASQIKAAIELGRRLTLESPEERPAINSPADAAALVQSGKVEPPTKTREVATRAFSARLPACPLARLLDCFFIG